MGNHIALRCSCEVSDGEADGERDQRGDDGFLGSVEPIASSSSTEAPDPSISFPIESRVQLLLHIFQAGLVQPVPGLGGAEDVTDERLLDVLAAGALAELEAELAVVGRRDDERDRQLVVRQVEALLVLLGFGDDRDAETFDSLHEACVRVGL